MGNATLDNESETTWTNESRPQLLVPRTGEKRTRVEAGCVVSQTEALKETLCQHVVGQDDAIEKLICASTRLLSGLRDPERPLLTALLLGPTGVGKTETAKALARALFGSPHAMTRVNCEEFSHGHEVSKLLGSPPGYVGSDVEPLLSQRNIDAAHRAHRQARQAGEADPTLVDELHDGEDGYYHSLVLFDEIEKAHPTVWNALLGILDDGMLSLGDNEEVDLTRSIILLTSNVGSRKMGELLDGSSLGFHTENGNAAPKPASLEGAALEAAAKEFPPEFLNRFDEILVYQPLEPDHLEQILDKFISEVHRRALDSETPLVLDLSPEARAQLIEEGTDPRFGARPLRRTVESEIVGPLSRLIATGALKAGDVVEVDLEEDGLAFYRVGRRRGARFDAGAETPVGGAEEATGEDREGP